MSDGDELEFCGVGIRGVSMAIDTVVWFALLFPATYAVAIPTGQVVVSGTSADAQLEGTLGLVAFVLWFGLALGYHAVLEWRYGQTLGKYLVKIRVANEDGSAPSLRSSIVRNLFRLVDFLPTLYLLGIVFVVLSDREERLGDRVGNTVVVRA